MPCSSVWRNATPEDGPRIYLTNGPIDDPWAMVDLYDDRSWIENGLFRNSKQFWTLTRWFPKRTEAGVRSHLTFVMLMLAIATAYRLWDKAKAGARPNCICFAEKSIRATEIAFERARIAFEGRQNAFERARIAFDLPDRCFAPREWRVSTPGMHAPAGKARSSAPPMASLCRIAPARRKRWLGAHQRCVGTRLAHGRPRRQPVGRRHAAIRPRPVAVRGAGGPILPATAGR